MSWLVIGLILLIIIVIVTIIIFKPYHGGLDKFIHGQIEELQHFLNLYNNVEITPKDKDKYLNIIIDRITNYELSAYMELKSIFVDINPTFEIIKLKNKEMKELLSKIKQCRRAEEKPADIIFGIDIDIIKDNQKIDVISDKLYRELDDDFDLNSYQEFNRFMTTTVKFYDDCWLKNYILKISVEIYKIQDEIIKITNSIPQKIQECINKILHIAQMEEHANITQEYDRLILSFKESLSLYDLNSIILWYDKNSEIIQKNNLYEQISIIEFLRPLNSELLNIVFKLNKDIVYLPDTNDRIIEFKKRVNLAQDRKIYNIKSLILYKDLNLSEDIKRDIERCNDIIKMIQKKLHIKIEIDGLIKEPMDRKILDFNSDQLSFLHTIQTYTVNFIRGDKIINNSLLPRLLSYLTIRVGLFDDRRHEILESILKNAYKNIDQGLLDTKILLTKCSKLENDDYKNLAIQCIRTNNFTDWKINKIETIPLPEDIRIETDRLNQMFLTEFGKLANIIEVFKHAIIEDYEY